MPARILLFAANLLPLIGVAFWGWDAFELLVLYWCETAVIAFWTIFQIGLQPERLDAFLSPTSRSALGGLGRAIFLSIHAGIFMAVHMVFLWSLMGGEWRSVISGPASFVQQLVIGNGLWAPLAGLFVVRGFITLLGLAGMSPDPVSSKNVVFDLYRRIIVMQFTLIAGAWAIQLIGSRIGLVVLIALKIAIDLFFDPFEKARKKPA
ncbi:hypothetical protein IZ6_08520 [Terrihabitans soli]|uniref:Uncharacterized protein n=1 Tax=Terrihabitans soli TaxID=708113 RepID=A0A6S6QQ78_9HYPH|nr:DUF6498-containing protein [Terrihabitans soli]BCJ90117.1 hypothetical protein IZ6_08520 [Terrihabitans soli]